jgi:ubiquinone/menaquinone biosynthesis C-methylase UbiE
MTKETKKWWEYRSQHYQKECKIPIDIHYGPGSPNEKYFKLLGNLKGKKVLEIGCGGAQCGIAMAKQDAKVTGIDISEWQLKFAKALAEKNKVKINLIQGSFQDLGKMKANSYDIAFSAFAFHYSPDLTGLFRQINRILKKKGLFVFSLDHPFLRTVNSKTLKLKNSYFKTGKWAEIYGKDRFVMYTHTISELYDTLIKSGFAVERIIEPDSRKRYGYDPWYGLWDYTPRLLKMVPPTIIFKCRKK